VSATRKLAAILVSDVAGYSRLAGTDEDRTLVRLRTLRSDLIDPIISVHHGRVVKRTGDGSIIGFRSGRRSPLRGRNSDQYGRLSGLDGGAEGIRTDGHHGRWEISSY
jgi:class 3 adenylate cyclase